MEVITDIAVLRKRLQHESSVALVPTMGNLHAGHLSLVKIAQQHAHCTVVSIFVNRLQFAPHEDFDRYPRTQGNDCHLLERNGVDIVFIPDERALYPVSQTFRLQLPPIADTLEGACRPGFFQGVATVVLKLFNIVQPEIAVFGEKDYQQQRIVYEMIEQLNLPISIFIGKTIRADDGLALSSRNNYLDAAQRQEATQLFHHLKQIRDAVCTGERNYRLLEQQAVISLDKRGWKTDYIAICHQNTLLPAEKTDIELVVLGAARLGEVRLIDNLPFVLS